jgi:hypothetical protein
MTEQQNANDSSIVDLLDRVHDHLLGDEYYEHNCLFFATDEATRQDPIFKFIEGEKPANQEPVPRNGPSSAQQRRTRPPNLLG